MLKIKDDGVKTRKTIFGNTFNAVKSRIKEVDIMSGGKKEVVCLSHGKFLCDFDVLFQTDNLIRLQSGKLNIALIKRS